MLFNDCINYFIFNAMKILSKTYYFLFIYFSKATCMWSRKNLL